MVAKCLIGLTIGNAGNGYIGCWNLVWGESWSETWLFYGAIPLCIEWIANAKKS
jgi:hypothetical protein